MAHMTNLNGILQSAHDRQLQAGGAVSSELVNSLKGYRKQQLYVFVCIEVLLIAAVAFCAYLLTRNPSGTATVKALSGLIGIGTGGGIEVMRRIWMEWSRTTLLLILIPQCSPGQLTSIIDKLAGKL